MAQQKNYVLAFALLVGLPSFATIGSTIVAQNPNWRPLAVTRELLENNTDHIPRDMIAVHVDWGRDQETRLSKADLRTYIDQALAKRTDAFFIRIREVEGTDIDVSFLVGANAYGPYTPRNLLYGMTPALEALRMNLAQSGS